MLKNDKTPGNDNISAELIKHGGESIIKIYTEICQNIWKTKIWPNIILSMDNKNSCYLVLLDLFSAFDTINQRILSYRIREIGIHGQVNNWLMSFLYNRISSVKIKSFFWLHLITLVAFLKGQY